MSLRTRWRFIRKLSRLDADIIYLPNYDSDLFDFFLKHLPPHVIKIIGDHSARRYDAAAQTGALPTDMQQDRLLRDAIQKFDAVHVVNPALAHVYANETPAKILNIPNVVTSQEFRGIADISSKRIIAAGRFALVKRFDILIKAMAKIRDLHPAWRLDLFGGGAEQAFYESIIAAENLTDNVTLCGRTSTMLRDMRKSAIHVSASESESFGLTIAEAMSVGLPTIALYNTAGAQFLHDDNRGYLANTQDVDGLVAILDKVIKLAEQTHPSLHTNIENAYNFTTALFSDQIKEQWQQELMGLHPR